MPRPGDFGVTATPGWKAWAIRFVTRSPVNHAILCVDDLEAIEGRPEGAGYIALTAYPDAIWSDLPLTDAQRASIVAHGRSHKDAPYSWLDDLAIGLADLLRGVHLKLPPFVRDRLKRKDRLQCAQLVDLSYAEAGVHLFPDNRYAGDVSPGDLLGVIQHHSPVTQGA
jgi:hypothetical protein